MTPPQGVVWSVASEEAPAVGDGSLEVPALSLGCPDGVALDPAEVDGSALGSSVAVDSDS